MTELITSIVITDDVVEHTTLEGVVIGAVTLAAGVTASFVGEHADKFKIVGSEIRVKDGHPINYETFYATSYVLEISASDGMGGTQTYFYDFTKDGATIIDSVIRQYGTENGEVMTGSVGKDRYNAYGGTDTIYGGDGDDWVTSGAGGDLIFGGAGQDVLCYMDSFEAISFDFSTGLGVGGTADGDVTYSMERIYGSSYNDVFIGSAEREHMYGHDGNDTIYGGGGHDHLTGDAGHDEVHGGAGDDTFKDDSGDDFMYCDGGKDRFFAVSGGDHYDGGADIDTVNFEFSSEAVALNLKLGIGWSSDAASDSYAAIERIKGTHYDDWIVGSDDFDRLYGNDGEDSVAAVQVKITCAAMMAMTRSMAKRTAMLCMTTPVMTVFMAARRTTGCMRTKVPI